MEALELLESRINGLIARLDALKKENSRLQNELSALAREKTVLAEENHNLHVSIAHGEDLRIRALGRIEDLLRKIQEHDNAGQVVL